MTQQMSDLYPPESQKMDFVGHLEELRRRIFVCLGVFVVAAVVFFANGRSVMTLAQRPIEGLVEKLIFITPAEVFTSYIKVSFLAAFIVCFPVFLYEVWMFLTPAVSRQAKKYIFLWITLGLGSFACGVFFSYYVAVPAALKFLLGFGKGIAVPSITLSKYVSFFGAFMLIGGSVFEIPFIIGVLSEAGIIKARLLRSKRQYAVLVIMVIAAVITPTQDIVNMMIFALPMLVLYETGIIIARFIERRKEKESSRFRPNEE